MRDAPSIHAAASAPGACQLFTATLVLRDAEGVVEVFHACRVQEPGGLVSRLAARLGPALASAATVRAGLDPLDPIVVSLLGAGIARALADNGDLPGGALLGGGDLHVVQRRG